MGGGALAPDYRVSSMCQAPCEPCTHAVPFLPPPQPSEGSVIQEHPRFLPRPETSDRQGCWEPSPDEADTKPAPRTDSSPSLRKHVKGKRESLHFSKTITQKSYLKNFFKVLEYVRTVQN